MSVIVIVIVIVHTSWSEPRHSEHHRYIIESSPIPHTFPYQSTPKSQAFDPFDGTQEKYSTFILQLSVLFQNDLARYGSEGIQIRTVAF